MGATVLAHEPSKGCEGSYGTPCNRAESANPEADMDDHANPALSFSWAINLANWSGM